VICHNIELWKSYVKDKIESVHIGVTEKASKGEDTVMNHGDESQTAEE
jgi:hypothetical protein